MAFPGPQLLAMQTPSLIRGLDRLHATIHAFLQTQKELLSRRDNKLTATDHEKIPEYLIETLDYLRTIGTVRDAITLKYHEMSNREILVIDDWMRAIKLQEARMEILVTWFRKQITSYAFSRALEEAPGAA